METTYVLVIAGGLAAGSTDRLLLEKAAQNLSDMFVGKSWKIEESWTSQYAKLDSQHWYFPTFFKGKPDGLNASQGYQDLRLLNGEVSFGSKMAQRKRKK